MVSGQGWIYEAHPLESSLQHSNLFFSLQLFLTATRKNNKKNVILQWQYSKIKLPFLMQTIKCHGSPFHQQYLE